MDEGHESAYMRANRKATQSWFGRFYEVEQRNSTVFQELRAGIVCFLTVCYIIPVNSSILADTGGPCTAQDNCSAGAYADAGANCIFFDSQFQQCQRDFKSSIIASTCIAAMLSTLVMSVFARMPLAVAPAMGVNAYFTYNVVGYLGSKPISYQDALAAVFVEGWIFIALSATGLRGKIVGLIPKNIMYATAAGIGCFLTFIGLQQGEGIAFVTYDPATLVTLGGCPPKWRERSYTLPDATLTYERICASSVDPVTNTTNWFGKNELGPPSANYSCQGGQMQSPTTWLGLMTGVIMTVLMMKDVKASILIGILFCTFISWIPTHDATFFDVPGKYYNSQIIPGGVERYTYWRKGVTVPDTSMSAGKLHFSGLSSGDTWVALVTFLYLDFLDATSTMFAMARLVCEQVPGFMDAHGGWPRQMQTMVSDGIGIVIGSLMGTSPLTVFAESAVGIREGGRTGITSLVVAFGFGISMFFSPIFASIPPFATGPAIILVGAMMMEHTRYINWDSVRVSVPAFLTIICMPLTYSVAYGIIMGLGSNIAFWICEGLWDFSAVFFMKLREGANYNGKTYRMVWLDTMSPWYICFNKEDVLLAELPGYVPEDHSGGHNKEGSTHHSDDNLHVKEGVETHGKATDRV